MNFYTNELLTKSRYQESKREARKQIKDEEEGEEEEEEEELPMADDEDLLFMQIAQQKAKATKKKAASAPLATVLDVVNVDEEDDLPESESGAARTEVNNFEWKSVSITLTEYWCLPAFCQGKQKTKAQ